LKNTTKRLEKMGKTSRKSMGRESFEVERSNLKLGRNGLNKKRKGEKS